MGSLRPFQNSLVRSSMPYFRLWHRPHRRVGRAKVELKRLFKYLREVAEREKCRFFITTHSHVVIDLFSRDELAQIVHVTNEGGYGKVRTVTDHPHHSTVFDDLDVRASDLLQANVVVWVEGPSDRTYFNRWIELWTGGQIREGVDYQCVFSAGSILSHFSFDEPSLEGLEEFVQALRVNRNAIVLMDSDRKNEDDPLKQRVERVKAEVTKVVSVTVREGTTISVRWVPDRNECVSAKWLPPVWLGRRMDRP